MLQTMFNPNLPKSFHQTMPLCLLPSGSAPTVALTWQKKIYLWTRDDVVKWLAYLNMSQYAEHLGSDIDGQVGYFAIQFGMLLLTPLLLF